MTACITTFSHDGYELYGRKMISSWMKYWPNNYHLIIYHEGYEIKETDDRITFFNLNDVCPNLIQFKKKSQDLLENITAHKQRNRILKTVKWCHKIYAMQHALSTIDDDYVVFLDGDTYTVNPVDTDFSQKLVENYLFAVHFENLAQGLHFESGLIVFNNHHKKIKWLTEILTSAYDTLDIYNMKKTWDGYWLAHLYINHHLPVKNLGSGVFSHPLVRKCLKHDVGVEKYRNAGYNEFSGKINTEKQ